MRNILNFSHLIKQSAFVDCVDAQSLCTLNDSDLIGENVSFDPDVCGVTPDLFLPRQ